MRKRFTKPILVGTVTVVVSAIVAGPAFGRFVPNAGSSPTQQAQQSRVSHEYPNLGRAKNLLTPAERRQLEAVAAAARNIDVQGSTSFVPGYTDFPNVLRLQNSLTATERRQLDAAVARSNSKASFVPGYTDFPNVLRSQSRLTPTERRQLDTAVAANTTTTVSSSGSDFSWSDAGIGIGIGLAIAAGLGLVALVGTRRNKATPVPA
jgi:hypothetical protein